FIASIVGILYMRQTLKLLDVLWTLPGILFLYIGAGIPMQVYLQFILSLDVLVLGFSSVALFFCLKIFWSENVRMLDYAFFIVAVVLAFYSKTSGFLLIALPLLAALLNPRGVSRQSVTVACALSLVCIVCTTPYFYLRIYLESGSFII